MKKEFVIKGLNKKSFSRKRNSRGEKLISVYWFAILVIVAVGIVLMVNSFYGNPYDVRKIESRILAEKVADCFYFGGKVNPLLMSPQGEFREDFKDRFLEKCSINFSTKNDFERPPYFVEAEFFSEKDLKNPTFTMSGGNKNWKPDCNISVSDKRELPVCNEKEFFMKGQPDSYYLVKITAIVGKIKKNVG